MAISNPSTVIDHTTDPAFRAWALNLRDLALIGGHFVQTADTNQFDFAAAVRPSNNTDSLPILLSPTDALQATAPYILAIYPGTGSISSNPRVRVAVGTGTNGSGTLTGTIIGPIACGSVSAPVSTTLSYENAAHATDGSLSIAFGIGNVLGSASQPVVRAFFGFHRIRNHAGDQTPDGVALYSVSVNGLLECYSARRVSPVAFGPHNLSCLIVGGTTTSVTAGGERQLYAHSAALPEARPVPEYLTGAAGEWSFGTVISAQPPGSNGDRSYKCLGNRISTVGAGSGASSHCLFMPWD
jgi:hypothetical protein